MLEQGNKTEDLDNLDRVITKTRKRNRVLNDSDTSSVGSVEPGIQSKALTQPPSPNTKKIVSLTQMTQNMAQKIT